MTQFKNYKNGDVLTKADYDAISHEVEKKWRSEEHTSELQSH